MNDNTFDSESNSGNVHALACRDVIERLGDFVDNDLSLDLRSSVENHLDDCAECASFFASYRHVIESAAELREPVEPIGVDVQNRLRKALNQRLGITLPYIA